MEEESAIKPIKTGDGSHTLYHPLLDETYHSSHGALTESKHVFIQNGLTYWIEKYPEKRLVRVLEVGLGTGLNAVLALQKALEWKRPVHYTALEPYPLPVKLIQQLNYHEFLAPQEVSLLMSMHEAEWGKGVQLATNFTLRKIKQPLEKFSPAASSYDVVFFDAFAPSRQPELWQEEALTALVQGMICGAVLVTYSAQGNFRRTLASLGLSVDRIPGPP